MIVPAQTKSIGAGGDAAPPAGARPARNLRPTIHALGGIALLAYLTMTALSYLQAPALWNGAHLPRTTAFFEGLAGQLRASLPVASAWLVESRPLVDHASVIVSYWAPLAIASAACLGLIAMLLRHGERADDAAVGLIFKWSLAFAAAAAPAFPVFTQDFWLSAAWGRMIAAGVNPYYSHFTPESLAGLPLDHFPMSMSYGPLWGILSAAVMALAGGSVLAAAILFKLVLATAWIGALQLVRMITAGANLRERCLALAVFGWAPVGVSQSLAEGHNDVVMMVLALLWLHLLLARRGTAPIALAASVLTKYVSAPLFLVDLIYALRYEQAGVRRYALRLVVPTLLGVAAIALFYRTSQFLDGVLLIRTWYFLRPQEAVNAIELLLGISLFPMPLAATAVFPALAIYQVWTAWTVPNPDNLLKSAIALMAATLFAAVSHVWPWYLVWVVAFAALLPSWWLSRLVFGVAIVAPFTLASWWVAPFAHHREVAALAMYLFGILWVLLTQPQPAAAAPIAASRHAPPLPARPGPARPGPARPELGNDGISSHG